MVKFEQFYFDKQMDTTRLSVNSKGKVKVKSHCLINHRPMETYWGSGGIALHILNLGTRWRSAVSFTPRPLYPQDKSLSYPMNMKSGRKQNWSGCSGEEKKFEPSPTGI
jgi:hypothetical protein